MYPKFEFQWSFDIQLLHAEMTSILIILKNIVTNIITSEKKIRKVSELEKRVKIKRLNKRDQNLLNTKESLVLVNKAESVMTQAKLFRTRMA